MGGWVGEGPAARLCGLGRDTHVHASGRDRRTYAVVGRFYGVRAFGPKHWYDNKSSLARRLKTQEQRRQLRMGLKSSFEFLNQLRMGDLRATLEGGDAAALYHIPQDLRATVAEFKDKLSLASPRHILRLFAPEKLDALTNILDGIEALADFNQRLGRHLALQPALEPIHHVLCDILRSRLDFASVTSRCPLNIATEAMRHQCSSPDDDAVNFEKPTAYTRNNSSYQRRRGNKTYQNTRTQTTGGARDKILKNCCHYFQKDNCVRRQCNYRHICDGCGSADHGYNKCPSNTDP